MLTILGLDPGTDNYGYGSVSFKQKKGRTKFRINEIGLLKNTVTGLKDYDLTRSELNSHSKELRALVKKYSPSLIIVERFTTRSFRTASAEIIPFMIGYTYSITRIPIFTTLAASWKNSVNRLFDLKAMYDEVIAHPHELDSVIMCFYQTNNLGLLENKEARKKLICQLERKTCMTPEEKERKKKKMEKAAGQKQKPKAKPKPKPKRKGKAQARKKQQGRRVVRGRGRARKK